MVGSFIWEKLMAMNYNTTNDWWNNDIGLEYMAQQAINQIAPTTGATMGTNAASNASTVAANRLSPSMMAQMNIGEMHHTMKGVMVTSGLKIAEHQKESMVHGMSEDGFKIHIKEQLCQLLVKDMMRQNLIEYTMIKETDGSFSYRARAYVMPDNMTKVLREYITRNT